MKGRLSGPTKMRELRDANSREPVSNGASIGTGVRPVPHAGNPLAGWNPVGTAACPVPAQGTRVGEYRVADRACHPDCPCGPPPASDLRAAIVLLPAPPGPLTSGGDIELASAAASIHRGTCMKTDIEARSEWHPSDPRGWTLDGFEAASAGTQRQRGRSRAEKKAHRNLRVTRRYGASPARVFDAWLDPAVARQWLFATALRPLAHVEIDAKVGGSFCFVDRQEAADITRYTGEYLEIRVTVEIAPLAKGCRLTVLHENVPRDHADHMHGRWTGILFGLGATLESASTLFNDDQE